MPEGETGSKGSESGAARRSSSGILEVLIDWSEKIGAAIVFALLMMSMIALVFFTFQVGVELWDAILGRSDEQLAHVLVAVLTVFIFIEVLRVSIHFLRTDHLDIVDLVDVTLAVIFREVWVGLFSKELGWQELLGLGALVGAIALLRWFAARPSPGVEGGPH